MVISKLLNLRRAPRLLKIDQLIITFILQLSAIPLAPSCIAHTKATHEHIAVPAKLEN